MVNEGRAASKELIRVASQSRSAVLGRTRQRAGKGKVSNAVTNTLVLCQNLECRTAETDQGKEVQSPIAHAEGQSKKTLPDRLSTEYTSAELKSQWLLLPACSSESEQEQYRRQRDQGIIFHMREGLAGQTFLQQFLDRYSFCHLRLVNTTLFGVFGCTKQLCQLKGRTVCGHL